MPADRQQQATLGYLFIYFGLFFFLALHPRHMEVPRPGVESELQPLVYTTATAMRDLSHVYDLHTPQLMATLDSFFFFFFFFLSFSHFLGRSCRLWRFPR